MSNNTLLQKICTDLGLWAGALYILRRNEELECVSSYNMPSDWERIKYDLEGDSLNARVFRIGEPAILTNLDTNKKEHARHKHPITALAVLPVVKNGLIVGTLELISDQQGYTFDINALSRLDTASLLA